MSLELQIEKLNANIEKLIAVMQGGSVAKKETKTEELKVEPKVQEPKTEEPKVEAKTEEKALTHTDLQKDFLAFVGKNREAAVALLAEFGAKNLKTVPEKDLPAFKAKLEEANNA